MESALRNSGKGADRADAMSRLVAGKAADIASRGRKCPHAGADMMNGELNNKGELLCPSHRMCLAGKVCG